MALRSVDDPDYTNPYGIGAQEQDVAISKKLIAERNANELQLIAEQAKYSRQEQKRLEAEAAAAAARGDADAAAKAAAAKQYADEKASVAADLERNGRLRQQTEQGLQEHEATLARMRAKEAATPPNVKIVNAGSDPAAQSPPTVPTLNETTANSYSPAPAADPFSVTPRTVGPATSAPAGVDLEPVPESANASSSYTSSPAAVDTETVPADANESSSYTSSPEGVDPNQDSAASAADAQAQLDEAVAKNDAQLYGGVGGYGAVEAGIKQKAQEQAALQARFNQPANGDWRVRLRIAPNSNYLYNSSDPGILAPLKASDGVIFPYTPSISTSYNANYDVTDLTHSNYRGQFYKNSNTGDITLNGTFTAQDTAEAEYMLAVIHFFRSVTKMFYGQDAQRGAPPPLVYLFGLGQYQFNNHPCVVKTFSYSLPTDVDYIRTQPNNYGQNLLNRRVATTSAPANTIGSVLGRLGNAVDLLGNILKKGALPGGGSRPGQPGVSQQAVYNTSNATYVPTKIEIQLSLLPIQTRNQVSQQFSLKDYANGALLRGGFW